jgi:hypothetical protein
MMRRKVGNTRMKDSPTEANHISSEDTPEEMGQALSKDSEDIPEVYLTKTVHAHNDDVPTGPSPTHDEDSPPEMVDKNSQDVDLHIEDISTAVDLAQIGAIPAIQRKKRKLKKLYIFAAALMLVCMLVSGLSFTGYQTYSKDYHGELNLAQEGMQHLRMAETLLKALPQKPFDSQSISRAQQEFAAASTDFVQVDHDLSSLPGIITLVPGYGSRLSAALHVLPIAIEVSRAGIIGCNVLNLVISRFHDPLSSKAQGLTLADFSFIETDFQQLKGLLNLVIDQIGHLQPSDLQLDPRLGKTLSTFQKDIPTLQQWFGTVEKLLPVAPVLLGIGPPANYLIELLDSTELRPGGGFIGNYGFVSLSGGRLTSANITNVYLLDRPFEASGRVIPFPQPYSWFDLSPATWTFRDSNLDANFPTAAHYSEANYKLEGGSTPIQGVITITPAFIQQALAVTGPIQVPEYNDRVTVQNLIDLIHSHQYGVGENELQRKHFTSVLAEHFLARVRQLYSTDSSQFLKLFMTALHTKDLQIYLNPSVAEDLLRTYHLDSAIEAPSSDSLFVVDANISPNKANNLITNTLDDQVVIDSNGNAIHHTTLSYAWLMKGQSYGVAVYRDYLRVYVPPGSILKSQNGWEQSSSGQAFGRQIWAGFFTLSFGQTRTITFVWTVPGAAKKGARSWDYQYLIQRQAGAQWTLHLQVMPPSCAGITSTQGGLMSSNNKKATMLTQPLTEDLNVGIDYACNT